MGKKKYGLMVFVFLIFSISLIQAETFGYGRTQVIPINYSLIPTVNNSQYLQSLTPQEVANLYTETDPLAYNGTLAYNSSLDSYVPYQGATSNVELGGKYLYLYGSGATSGSRLNADSSVLEVVRQHGLFDGEGFNFKDDMGTMYVTKSGVQNKWIMSSTNTTFNKGVLAPSFNGSLNGDWNGSANYYLKSNPFSFYNSTSLNSLSQLTDDLGNRGYTDNLNFTNGAGYYNSTTLDLSSYVPYTGATTNVDLGIQNLTTTGTVTAEQITSTDDITMAGILTNTLGSSDAIGLILNQDSAQGGNDYTGTASNFLLKLNKRISTPDSDSGVGNSGVSLNFYNTHKIIGSTDWVFTTTYGFSFYLNIQGAHSTTGMFGETNKAIAGKITRQGDITATNVLYMDNYGFSGETDDYTNYNSAGNSITMNNYGGWYKVKLAGTETAGTLNKNAYGIYIKTDGSFNPTNGVRNDYGVYIAGVDASNVADTAYGIYDKSGKDWALASDNQFIRMGQSSTDFSMGYDGTNPVFNTSGSGAFTFYNGTGLGKIRALEYATSTPKDKKYNHTKKYIDDLPVPTELLDSKGKIKRGTFRNAQTTYLEKDYNNCWIVKSPEWCYSNKEGTEFCQKDKIAKWKKRGFKNETLNENPREECGSKEVNVTLVDTQAFENTVMISELKEENEMLKSELCSKGKLYSWCK